MNIIINRCNLPTIRKNQIYKISLGNLFLDHFILNKNYLFSNKKIIQTHFIGSIGDLVIIHDKKTIIEGFYDEFKFYNLEDQSKLKGIFPEINETSFNFSHKNLNLLFHKPFK